MLDTIICKILGIDNFAQEIMARLDMFEEQLHTENLSPIKYIEIKAKYEELKIVRDMYAQFLANK